MILSIMIISIIGFGLGISFGIVIGGFLTDNARADIDKAKLIQKIWPISHIGKRSAPSQHQRWRMMMNIRIKYGNKITDVFVREKQCRSKPCFRPGHYTHHTACGASGCSSRTDDNVSCLTRENHGCPKTAAPSGEKEKP